MIRQHLPNTEIIILGRIYGDVDPSKTISVLQDAKADDGSYDGMMRAVAEKYKVTFIPLQPAVFGYIVNNKLNYMAFHRDYIHANLRGSQLVGRYLLHWFDAEN